MTNHTPGPWHLIETEPGIDADMDVFVTTPRYAGGKGLIARVVDADDAVLISAAPAMLEALQRIADSTSEGGNLNRIARVAIAAAIGGITKEK